MDKLALVAGLAVLALALRGCRHVAARKLGALTFLVASFFALYFIFDRSLTAGLCGVFLWFFLPWIELLTRIRRLRLPIENRLRFRVPPADSFFPHAPEAVEAMDREGFEHATDSGWEWAGMTQFFRIFWNPEKRAIATICLCEQNEAAFAFISITSRNDDGHIFRTTNFPFSPTLKYGSEITWNQVPCECSCFHEILHSHRQFLKASQVPEDNLRVPDPDEVVNEIEGEMRSQIDHNLSKGIIQLTGDGHFRYSFRGLFFLWRQIIKDLLRLC